MIAIEANVPDIITSLGVFVTACAAAVSIVRNGKVIKGVDRKVDTVNGRSLGILAELNEGRRIRHDIVPEQRTVREQSYVNLLEQVERDGSVHEMEEDVALGKKGQQGQGPGDARDMPY
jgi:hypothetical protein